MDVTFFMIFFYWLVRNKNGVSVNLNECEKNWKKYCYLSIIHSQTKIPKLKETCGWVFHIVLLKEYNSSRLPINSNKESSIHQPLYFDILWYILFLSFILKRNQLLSNFNMKHNVREASN